MTFDELRTHNWHVYYIVHRVTAVCNFKSVDWTYVYVQSCELQYYI